MTTESTAGTLAERMGVALVGCGVIGRTHVQAIRAFDELELVALVDPVVDARREFADGIQREGGARPTEYDRLDEALADPRVQLVVVGTPTGLHAEQGLAALRAGRHVIIEKPLDVDMHRAREIVAEATAAAGRGVVGSVISQHRFDDATRAVRAAIDDGRLGVVTSAIATSPRWRTQAYYDSGDWRGTWAMDGGGALMNQGVHTLDVLLALLGRPVEISARTALLAHERVEVEDTMVATIEFESGALAVMHASTAASPGLASRVQVMGSAGSAIIDDDQLLYLHAEREPDGSPATDADGDQSERALAALGAGRHDDIASGGDARDVAAGHVRQYADVLRAIREGGRPGVRIDEAAIVLATVRAVYLSATLGAPVRLEDVMNGRYDDTEVRTGRA
ncbi:Gfo/Idh/MocA family oxidoreductase [Pseudolysinimonas kribbensis]|uniref:Oxidoreductase n=1 Tax=Pseudolysinimonas kribbensis TaxID=433641 RepID=A0ABQ6K446_9MICO|nr:Gfo/Idh/MocA family oxidoreductase [Pseudolysinimonas kribbensis]GMA94084.1 oxidoreductase [Pseudolysinimonas kribbensis]